MNVIWTLEALQDRDDVWDFISADSPGAAARMDNVFSTGVAKLGRFPNLGQPGRVAGTREFIFHESYRLVYEVERDVVWVLALVHTARQWPPARD